VGCLSPTVAPELFSAPVLRRLQEKWRSERDKVPFFYGLLTGEIDALVGSFAGVPEVQHPVRRPIRGVRPFEALSTIRRRGSPIATSRSRTSSIHQRPASWCGSAAATSGH
jgi:hypothetical protein